jgi:hypothetical protein
MSRAMVTATIAELDEMLADGTYDRCCVKTLARILLVMTRRTRCQRAAQAVVTVTCSEHGPDTWAVCGKHLRAIQRRPWLLRCGTCHNPASLEGADA